MQPWKIRLRTYLTGTWHYRWIGMGVAWAVCLIGWLAVAMVPNQFQAVSMIYVDTDTMMAPLLRDLTVSTDPQQQVSVMLNTLLARPNLEQVVHLTNPKANSLSSAELAKQVENLQDNISIKPLSTKNLFQLSYTDRDPDKEELGAMGAYAMAATVDFGLDAKQGLLDLRSENARLRLVTRLFRAAIKRLDFVDRAQERARSNGKVRFG